MTLDRWHYFLSLEKDFVRTIDFVELNAANAKAYSNEYAKLLLLIGSEVDVTAKMLCQKVAAGQTAYNIDDWRKIITTTFKDSHSIEIDIPRYLMKVQPWLTWGQSVPRSPDWWKAYNNVKHERNNNFADANQKNVTEALCGLLALLLYLHKDEEHLRPYPILLNYGFPDYLVSGRGKKLPGT
jgi:hypothetical protein